MKTLPILGCALMLLVGCGDDDMATDGGPTDMGPADVLEDVVVIDAVSDFAVPDGGPMCEVPSAPMRTCTVEASDYTPNADDTWVVCVSDDGEYHRIEPTISSIQRVAAFDQIQVLLAPTIEGDPPSPPSFVMARMIYQQEQGLDSRVVRRFDPRFEVPDGTDCTQDGVPAMFPDHCIGPARLQPLLLTAFNDGIMGEDPAVAAATINAGLLYFLTVSVFKESFTCTTKPKDCDSAYAYYTGGEAARGGIGLAGILRAVNPDAHDRMWDALLGLRCWRDIDPAMTATMPILRDAARDQMGRALMDGIASMVRVRAASFCGQANDADWAFITTLGPVLMPNAEARDATAAAVLETQFGLSAAEADANALITALDTLFPCP